MRVNPDYVSGLVNSLDQATLNEQTLTEELSSGVKVNSLSDNPAAAGENVLLTSQLSADDTFSTTAGSAENLLQVADSALGNVVTQLTTAVSLATQANNGVLNASNQQAVATELIGIRDEVLSLANSSYLGQYIFAGSQGSTQPFTLDTTTSPNTVTYNGDDNVSYVQTPAGQKIQLNVPGDQIFTAAGGNVLGSLNALINDFSTEAPSATSVADLASLSQSLGYVDQQRAVIDNSINRLTASSNYASSESTQLLSAQDNLIQTDTASVATQLSTAETQQAALTQIIAALDQQGTLFQAL
ncbi:MAG TPA: flagellar hook-associated protein FlgL [Silvibacterium sp.]|nr:flagellar hook-associated protein FlgL [Silvibacterium sp.]